jgi:hypothetical protein
VTIHQLPPPAAEDDTARLAAQISAQQPSLLQVVRSTSTRVCGYADLLEAELKHFRPLEGYLADAVRHVERRTGRPVSDDLYNRLCDRLGITDVRLALERVARAHPDEPEEPKSDVQL